MMSQEEADSCEVLISGISGIDENDLTMFFESRKYCPSGGEVDQFRLLTKDQGVITFKDSQVIKRLGSYVIIEEKKIFLEPYKEQRPSKDKQNLPVKKQPSLTDIGEEQDPRYSGSDLLPSKCHDGDEGDEPFQSCESDGGSDANSTSSGPQKNKKLQEKGRKVSERGRCQSSKDLLQNYSGDSSKNRYRSDGVGIRPSKSHDNFSFDPSTASYSQGSWRDSQSRVQFFETGGNPSEESETDESTSEELESNGNEISQDRILSSSLSNTSSNTSLVRDQCASDQTVKEISGFSDSRKTDHQEPSKNEALNNLTLEKLQLLKLIWDTEGKSSPHDKCVVKFNEEFCLVTLAGTDNILENTRMRLLELIQQFESEIVKVSLPTQKMFHSEKGKEWLTSEFTQLDLSAVFYVKDDNPYLIAKDETILQSAVKHLNEIVSCQTVPFEDDHRLFLGSPTWLQVVETMMKSSLISVVVTESSGEIEITGRKNDVENSASEISDLLKINVPTERTMKSRHGIVRLLKKNEKTIKDFIRDVVSVDISFQPSDALIKLSGLPNDVDLAAQLLASHIQNILYDKVEIDTPGLMKDEFMASNSTQHDVIELLESRHECVIEVRSKNSESDKKSEATVPAQDVNPSSNDAMSSDAVPVTGIKVISGSITEFKADVLVNTIADKRLEKGGAIQKLFLKAGGANLEQELRQHKIPAEFGQDVVVTSAHGTIDAKFILHAAIAKYRNENSVERLYNTIKKCLEMAMDKHASTIAFPTLGCGKLGFRPEDMISCFIRAERETKTSLKIFIIAFEEDLSKKIESVLQDSVSSELSHQPRSSKSETFKTNDAQQPDVTVPAQDAQPSPAVDAGDNSATSIKIVSGSITGFKADILVNTIGDKRLEKGGVIVKLFLDAGAPALEQELRQLKIPVEFGQDVVVTSAHGTIDAKFVFHAAVGKYRNEDSVEKLYNTIKKCLEMAMDKKAATIAFPTIGCGKLGFRPKDMISCFLRAERDTKTGVKIFIVAFEEDLSKQIGSHLQELVSSEAKSVSKDVKAAESSSSIAVRKSLKAESESNLIVFHINAMSKDKLDKAKKELTVKIKSMTKKVVVKEDIIAQLDEEQLETFRKLSGSTVHVNIDQRKNTIHLRGEEHAVIHAKVMVTSMLANIRAVERYPVYWTRYKLHGDDTGAVRAVRVPLPTTSPFYKEVSDVVMKTWDQTKVGLGKDSKGLGSHAIKIVNISCIESPLRMEKYMAERKLLSKTGSSKPFISLKGQNNEADISTMMLGLQNLYGTLSSAVNEVFLFHGTKSDALSVIESDGIDARVCGGLFGYGSYFAESSSKADQYADPKEARVAHGQPLYMYLCRVLLGSTYVCNNPKNVTDFRRPPCSQSDCLKAVCKHSHRYNSVVGTHRPEPNTKDRLNFREFIVYLPDQSYPDFLIEYQRVNYP